MQNAVDLRCKAMNILGETECRRLLNASSEVQANGCKVWMGTRTAKGYGLLKVVVRFPGCAPQIVRLLVHWLAWRLEGREIPSGRGLCHSPQCVSRACWNLPHLRTCTRSENEHDKRNVSGRTKGESHV